MLDSLKAVMDLDRVLTVLQTEGALDTAVTWQTFPVFQAVGCSKCQEGYKGRMGIYEIFEMTPSLQEKLTATVTSEVIEEKAREEQRMTTMLEDGMVKVVQGLTSIEEVLRVAKE
jgi:type II secretory ATPase GspE/PulE/Tfp pilus assembly ATPase PilB-like protein